MTTVTWETATDWDNTQSEDGVVHEAVANTDHDDDGVVKKGYSHTSPLFSSNLVGYWPLNEDSGSTAYDFSGNGYDGTLNGPTVGQTGLLGTSTYSFDGADDYISIPTVNEPGNTDRITMVVWVNMSSLSSRGMHISSRDEAGGGGTAYSIGTDSAGTIRWQIKDESVTFYDALGSTSYDDGNWHMLAGTYDGSDLTAYVDVSEDANTSVSSGTILSPSVSDIGRLAGNTTNYTNGRLAYPQIYDRALSVSELQTLYDIVVTNGTLTTAAKTS